MMSAVIIMFSSLNPLLLSLHGMQRPVSAVSLTGLAPVRSALKGSDYESFCPVVY